MTSYNKMVIIGNVGRDSESRFTQGGTQVTSFSVAVTEKRKSQDGEATENTQWFNCSAWGKLAEVAASYVKKGMRVYIEGPLTLRHYTAQDGTQRSSLDINVRELQMLSFVEDGEERAPQPSRPGATRESASAPRRQAVPQRSVDDTLDDVPF